MPKDYYAILGVSKTASEDELKKAFRRLAHEHHPDKGGDASKFKDINEAYQVLGDAKKRQTYDQFGSAAFENGGGGGPGGFPGGGFGGFPGGMNFNGQDMGDLGDILGEMFGFAGGGGGGSRSRRGKNIEIDIELSFRDAIFGVEKSIKLYRQQVCSHCKGEGAEPGTKVSDCKTCHGTGQVTQSTRTMFGTFQSHATCKDCHGRGKKPETPCKTCKGYGVEQREQSLSIRIPAGVDDGTILQVNGEGEAPSGGGRPGDLFVRVHVAEDANFAREGNDIVSEFAIPFSILALGGSVQIPTIDGNQNVAISESTPDGTLITIRGQGVPFRNGGRGNHIVRVIADVPRKLTKEQKKLLDELRNTGL